MDLCEGLPKLRKNSRGELIHEKCTARLECRAGLIDDVGAHWHRHASQRNPGDDVLRSSKSEALQNRAHMRSGVEHHVQSRIRQ